MRFVVMMAGLIFFTAVSTSGHAEPAQPPKLADAVELAIKDACTPLLRNERTIEDLANSGRLPFEQSKTLSRYSPKPTLLTHSADGGQVEVALNDTSCTIFFSGPDADGVQAEEGRRLNFPGSGWRHAYWENPESNIFEQRQADADPPGVTVVLDDPEQPGGRHVVAVLAPESAQPSLAELKAAAARPLPTAVADAVLDQCVALMAAVRAHPGPGTFTSDWSDAQRRRYWAWSKWDEPNEMLVAADPASGEAKIMLVLDQSPAVNCTVHASGSGAAASYDTLLQAARTSGLWDAIQLPAVAGVRRAAFFSPSNSLALTLVNQGDVAFLRVVQVDRSDDLIDLADWLPKAFTPAASRHSKDAIVVAALEVCVGYVENPGSWSADRAKYYLREYGLTPYWPPVTASDPDKDVSFVLKSAPLSCTVSSQASEAAEGVKAVLNRLRADHRWQAKSEVNDRNWTTHAFQSMDGLTQLAVRQMRAYRNVEIEVKRLPSTK